MLSLANCAHVLLLVLQTLHSQPFYIGTAAFTYASNFQFIYVDFV